MSIEDGSSEVTRDIFKKASGQALKAARATEEIFKDKGLPTKKELEKSRLYFGELEDALEHYSSPFAPGQHKTITVRTNEDGDPQVEIVSETRFPPLDDIKEHCQKLRFAALQLDKLPASFWSYKNYTQRFQHEGFPYISMQILDWGTHTARVKMFFSLMAKMSELQLSSFAWKDQNDSDFFRDEAEQSFRMLAAYLALSEYFTDRGLPEGAEYFHLLSDE
ncbi:hypothetical protein A3A14_00030 [Candidatus Daviesbacteria bacterium RIFCSPLOWO2_01_FULL_43_38]|uniref:Uncharacterized protein n=3 Tax=Candidatus Daviesiibacteriota TaxID=1752718 RepID=A0A1F5K636_9BACT|nr:MAG: hypothetical protein UV33_C0011G0004 [Candidatus Daviesbacteria bacterium GW2011_GWA1_42_6]KKS70840.1 MAG: hypothetical protein UV41_C0011G0002 [Candidatus Daviesbacteria bacterium GW2011_GWA2_42_7]OGE20086.1 MAG: hypothetical protein A2874_02665 [Candidatus Daviesbacteria bacterium RIFCSPHIGHO2_01_FULL_43_17]OGE36426.1 MAG: hypothetical protein A3E45_00705 [Candidatus Daviesbacteria bacterium RIFCSPHIGHO2_12_FULL_43_11]OGE63839.1 MAG: hypothetical protein A3A14_00030 [Candidatus Davies